jgi:hypothetical protein
MTRKKKIAVIVFLALLGIVFVPLLFLKAWAAYKLGEVNAQQTAQGTLIPRANTPPEGKNLYEHPLWLDDLKENTARRKKLSELSGEEYTAAALQPDTNALSRWCNELRTKYFQYDRFKSMVDKEVVPQPGNPDSTRRELLPTFESLRKGIDRRHDVPVPPGLRPMVEKYLEREDISDEEKVIAVFTEYFRSEDPATEEEVKKSLAESSYFGVNEEIYTKLGLSEADVLLYPVSPSPSLKTLAQHFGHTSRWHAYSGQREKTLEELKPLLDMAGLEGCNSISTEGWDRIVTRAMAANTVHAIILEDVLNEEDLLSIQTRFSRMNMMEDLRLELENEEVYGGKELDVMFDPSFTRNILQWSFFGLVRFSGYIDLSEAIISQAMRGFRAAIDTEGQTLDYAAWKRVEDLPRSMSHILARQTIPAVGKSSNKYLLIQSQRDAVILGCALERYRLKEGSFPEKLEALIPEYLPQMPPGSLSQGSLSYTRTEKGYELISNKLPELPPKDRMETVWRR